MSQLRFEILYRRLCKNGASDFEYLGRFEISVKFYVDIAKLPGQIILRTLFALAFSLFF